MVVIQSGYGGEAENGMLSGNSSEKCLFFFFFFFTFTSIATLFYFFSFIFISWRLITLQYCSGFCHTLT